MLLGSYFSEIVKKNKLIFSISNLGNNYQSQTFNQCVFCFYDILQLPSSTVRWYKLSCGKL